MRQGDINNSSLPIVSTDLSSTQSPQRDTTTQYQQCKKPRQASDEEGQKDNNNFTDETFDMDIENENDKNKNEMMHISDNNENETMNMNDAHEVEDDSCYYDDSSCCSDDSYCSFVSENIGIEIGFIRFRRRDYYW